MHTIVPRDRKRAVVLAAAKGDALSRRPDGRPGPPLRATAASKLVGTWGNRGARSLLSSPH
jgi:hypothetical protein